MEWPTRGERVLTIGALAALAAVGVLGATGFRPALDVSRPPLGDVVPLKGRSSEPLARRVVLLVIDGLRADVARDLPELQAMAGKGAALTCTVSVPSVSRPGYVTLLTGVPPRLSGVRSNAFDRPVAVDGLPAVLARRGRRALAVAHEGSGLATLFPDLHVVSPAAWEPAALEEARAGADLVLLLLPDVDVAGHLYGGASREYREAASQAGRFVGMLLAAMDLERDSLIVTADHGHVEEGGHGGAEPEVLTVPLLFCGAGVPATAGEAPPEDATGVAVTIARLLGVPSPGHAVGRVWGGVGGDAARAADEERITELARRLEAPGVQSVKAALATRALRAVATAAAVIAILARLTRLRRRGSPVGGRHVVAAGLALAYCVALAVTSVGGLSPSRVPHGDARLPWVARIAAFALLGTGVILVAAMRRKVARKADAAHVAIVAVALTLALEGATFTLLWPPFPTLLPPPPVLVLAPIIMMAAAMFAASIAVVTSLAWVRS